jgi:protein-disulfide isomerase
MKKEIIKKIIIGAFIFVVIGSLVGSLVYFFPRGGGGVPREVKKAIEYINEVIKEQGQTASLISWGEEAGLYKVVFQIGENQYQVFLTKDGKYLFPYAPIDLTQKIEKKTEETQTTQVEKREKPDVKLFVMSYCPFGLQMEKALLPVWKLLKDKADIGIYFVDYIMHGKKEMEENLRQYCIQKEEKEKYLAYLECFAKNGSYENSEIYKDCLKETGINENKLDSCYEKTDKEFKISENFSETGYPPFNIHKDLNEKYGVRGSPTLVINDTVINVERSPEKVKEAICNAFLNPPEECNQKLPEETASPGFGMATGSSSSGSCQ